MSITLLDHKVCLWHHILPLNPTIEYSDNTQYKMITISPIQKALVAVDSSSAAKISAPNYDEFQGNHEIFNFIKLNPESVLGVTMAHCAVPSPKDIMTEGSTGALSLATDNIHRLIKSNHVKVLSNVIWIYEIEGVNIPGIRQIGLGGMAKTAEIRTDPSSTGSIIRNEGIREYKSKIRADLIERTNSLIGTVNLAVKDENDRIATKLENYADGKKVDFSINDEHGNIHKIWIVTEEDEINRFIKLFADEPSAYVADGNHRSAAALMLGAEEFLAVFFTVNRMGLSPYNRLLKTESLSLKDSVLQLKKSFDVTEVGDLLEYRPTHVHDIGLYLNGIWRRLVPKESAYEKGNSVEEIDADIVQRKIFKDIFGFSENNDKRITFVGGNKDSRYLKEKVDSGEYNCAISLAPVTMEQFVNVCEQNRFMPPKSTWFDPKIRSGLIIAIL